MRGNLNSSFRTVAQSLCLSVKDNKQHALYFPGDKKADNFLKKLNELHGDLGLLRQNQHLLQGSYLMIPFLLTLKQSLPFGVPPTCVEPPKEEKRQRGACTPQTFVFLNEQLWNHSSILLIYGLLSKVYSMEGEKKASFHTLAT